MARGLHNAGAAVAIWGTNRANNDARRRRADR